jgi:hypothetical protein
VALLLHGRQEVGPGDDVEHGGGHVADERVARERGAVVAWWAVISLFVFLGFCV